MTEGYGRIHVVIPDTQVRPGVPIDHLDWISQYIVDKVGGLPNVSIIHLGDHWDMPSLSSYDKGKKRMEGRRYTSDVQAGNTGMLMLNARPEEEAGDWWASIDLRQLRGNHEERIVRAAEDNAQMDGALTLDDLESPGWKIVPFLDVLELDGIAYSHYFYNPMNSRPYGGLIDTRLKNVGRSFTMGHQQVLMYGLRQVSTGTQHGLVAGSAYLHHEDYLGPQGNDHWRGIIICYGVENGAYSPMFVTLDYLCWRYEGVRLKDFKPRAVLDEDGFLPDSYYPEGR